MRVIAAITDPAVAKRILECMGLAPRAPPLRSASVQGSAATPWFEEPAEDFDQTLPDHWDWGVRLHPRLVTHPDPMASLREQSGKPPMAKSQRRPRALNSSRIGASSPNRCPF
jgi:hypothetical protein